MSTGAEGPGRYSDETAESLGLVSSPQSEPRWYTVTYRGTAEMIVWVQADSAAAAKQAAEDAEYDDATDVEFVRGRPYTMKARLAPDYEPPERY